MSRPTPLNILLLLLQGADSFRMHAALQPPSSALAGGADVRMQMAPAASTPAAAAAAVALLVRAAETRAEESHAVIEALVGLEKTMRAEAKADAKLSGATLDALDGAWRLCFTTGTVDTQKKIGKINYFPLKAVQTFDTTTEPMAITNGIYVGDVALVRFFGPFEFNEGTRKLTFDFDEISLLGLRIPLPKGGAAQIGAASGLGSKSNVARAKRELPAFFNWISAPALPASLTPPPLRPLHLRSCVHLGERGHRDGARRRRRACPLATRPGSAGEDEGVSVPSGALLALLWACLSAACLSAVCGTGGLTYCFFKKLNMAAVGQCPPRGAPWPVPPGQCQSQCCEWSSSRSQSRSLPSSLRGARRLAATAALAPTCSRSTPF